MGNVEFQDYARLSNNLFRLLSSTKTKEELIVCMVILVQEEINVESVGIRFKDGHDYPYYFTRGFAQDFVEKEMYLCALDQEGEMIRDSDGNPVLECMCGNIIAGRTDPNLPFFTHGGSFYSNCTSELLANTTEEERQSRTRNRCNGEGYESVALIPIKTDGVIYGLLQLNDRRKDVFTPMMISFLEGAASVIAILFSFIQAKEILSKHVDDVNRLIDLRKTMVEQIASDLKESSAQNGKGLTAAPVHEKLDELLREMVILKGIIPICCRCKRIRNHSDDWEPVESYIHSRSKADFTHTYCPDCLEIAMKEIDELGKKL